LEDQQKHRTALIFGAGPAGLTAALELLRQTDVKPIILEAGNIVGGLSQSADFYGNKIDIGPHRFFSKSDKVIKWWFDILPLQKTTDQLPVWIHYHNNGKKLRPEASAPDPDKEDKLMLLVKRQTRILHQKAFFDYPVSLSLKTLKHLGLIRSITIGFSYLKSLINPLEENSLEDFFINRFGKELYQTFFKSYTEKVWGVKCSDISAEWGRQRIKKLSIGKTVRHFVNQALKIHKVKETSLIEQFLYPKLGAGQMWEEVAKKVIAMGGEIYTGLTVNSLNIENGKAISAKAVSKEGTISNWNADYFISSMPVKDLVSGIYPSAPDDILQITKQLQYRDLIVAGLLLPFSALSIAREELKDNWLYLQENHIIAARIQLCNNMSPYLVKDPDYLWLGMEYFCYKGDSIWNMTDEEISSLAVSELRQIGILQNAAEFKRESKVIRVEKAYPAYFGSYADFPKVKNWLDRIENLFLIGRNGMHKYNNQDHSMLTAMEAVENIRTGRKDKSNIWNVNTEQEYIEEEKIDDSF
jgi:protoporphyrinogen oxidase